MERTGEIMAANITSSIELDVPGALRRVGGDRELLCKIIDFVVEDSPQFLERMGTALGTGDYPEVERAAHSLRGLVSNLRCEAVEEKASQIEKFARTRKREAIATAVDDLSDLTQKMMLKIDEVRRDLTAQGHRP